MATSAATFDNNILRWAHEQGLPWQQLKYRLVQSNLAKHLRPGPLHVLDAGGGNGFDSIPLAQQGHEVEIVDYSTEMLAQAKRAAALTQTQERVRLNHADLRDVQDLFPEAQFDLVLCHNVLQYVDDALSLLKDLVAALKSGGLISVVGINRYSIAYRTAFAGGDLAQALMELDARSTRAIIFDLTLRAYSAEEVGEMLESAGCAVEQDYGVRCICDYWGDNDLKSDPTVFAQLEQLEFALTERHPYKLLARYFQVVARKA
jgi:S-adenosylmethionine-dependent methyltransferase